MQAQQKIESDETKYELKLINKDESEDSPEDLQQIFDDIDAGRNLSKVYTNLDEMWKDLNPSKYSTVS
ncbi:MAG: hypothetical protein IJ575_02400 [Selenomonadaceae bacterium]|nr:hypothetical protein [Selenomonadaceae bacterium]